MKTFYVFLISILFSFCLLAQKQTIRGKVSDSESKYPLMFANVFLYRDTVPVNGVTTDTLGDYRIENISIGKYTLRVSYLGYSPAVLPGIIVNSGKETVLDVELEEDRNKLQEVTIQGSQKDQAVNEMSLVSTRTFSVEEANRYAGSRGDPGRMASNFAGVQGSDDSRNDIVIRGNSPLGVLWRINGIDMPNPNHFAIPGTTGGGVTMFNNKTLTNSDFLTGAFSAEYGNTISGVFDIRLRNGNNEKHEFTGQLGFLGTELSAEGPLSKNKHSSYLVAYRYSTLRLFESLNIKIGTEAIPNYQDITFKLNFPGKKGGNFFVYGIGGASDINIKVSEQENPEEEIYGEKDKDQLFKTSAYLAGIGKTFNIGPTLYAQMKFAYQRGKASAEDGLVFRDNNYVVDSIVPCLGYTFINDRYSVNAEVVKKINSTLTFKSGINADYLVYDLIDSIYSENTYKFTTRLNYTGHATMIQPYALFKYKLTDRIVMNAGLHGQIYEATNSVSIEPRLSMRYSLGNESALSFGFGMHSQAQPYYIYYYEEENANGNKVRPNENLSFTRSNHFVLGYDRSLINDSRIKAEIYYMRLYDVPVTISSSSYSMVNEGAEFSRFFPDSLQNDGTGHNEGVELTYEKFFSKSYYLLFTASLFDSKYKGSDGVQRNTSFNGRYILNVLGGRDFRAGEHSIFSTGFKMTWGGGKRYSPVDTAASNMVGDIVIIDSERNSLQFRDYFRFDLKLGLKINSQKLTHEFAIDLVNLFGNKNILSLTYVYDPRHPEVNPVKEEYQLGFLPLFYYKIDF